MPSLAPERESTPPVFLSRVPQVASRKIGTARSVIKTVHKTVRDECQKYYGYSDISPFKV